LLAAAQGKKLKSAHAPTRTHANLARIRDEKSPDGDGGDMFSPERLPPPASHRVRGASREKSGDEDPKSSYYVWYLGCRESGGLRGEEHVRPVVRQLLREDERRKVVQGRAASRQRPPGGAGAKVTLQVSQRGLRVVGAPSAALVRRSPSRSGPTSLESTSSSVGRHFIPHSSVTCVARVDPPDDDVVACILLSPSNGKSECPLYVNCYR